jgi:uncharacterized protein YbaR (Trm112 family)
MNSDDQDRQDASGRTDRKLLEMLVCPLTRTRLEYDAERQELTSRAARLAFPIRDGVPLMTREAARHLDDDADTGGSRARD